VPKGPKSRPLGKGFPPWNHQCIAYSWQTGDRCKRAATRGTNHCKRHGGGGAFAALGWKRYLLWVLLPDSIRTTSAYHSPVTEEQIEILCNVLAQWVVTGDAHASEAVRMKAVEYLLDSVAVNKHEDPASLLTHLSHEDAVTAVRILRLNNLMK